MELRSIGILDFKALSVFFVLYLFFLLPSLIISCLVTEMWSINLLMQCKSHLFQALSQALTQAGQLLFYPRAPYLRDSSFSISRNKGCFAALPCSLQGYCFPLCHERTSWSFFHFCPWRLSQLVLCWPLKLNALKPCKKRNSNIALQCCLTKDLTDLHYLSLTSYMKSN